ncbi:hypothetical protein MHTCC0001_01520 [Flavobacteriaceae bacterium MHTCC 0001]
MKEINKALLLLILIFTITDAIAQKEVLSIPFGYKSTFYDSKESLAISNKATGGLVLFIEDSDVSKAFLLDANLVLKGEIFCQNLPNAFKEFIGHQINTDGSYSIFYTNNSKKKLGELNINFLKKNATAQTLDFKLKKEAYVESISHNGKFYFMSATRGTSDLNFYCFNDGKISNKNTISLDFLEEIKNDYLKKAFDLLVSKAFTHGSLVKMDNETPNAIETTSRPHKLYIIDDKFVFTFDNNKKDTKIVSVNPDTFDFNVLNVDQPEIDGVSEFINHNSYLYDDKIFQIKSSSSSMRFTVKDYRTQELIKEIVLNKEDSITFKNTPIIQEGPAFIAGKRTRKMEATSKFLRKISAGDIGIAVHKKNNKNRITLGSKKEIRSGGAMMPMGGFGGIPMGGFGPLSASFNPTFFAYGGYSSTKTVRIECLFNNDFQHIEGDIPDNVFDDIKAFEDTFTEITSVTKEKNNEPTDDIYGIESFDEDDSSNKPKLKNVFRHDDKLYFGFIGSQDKNYHLIEFED